MFPRTHSVNPLATHFLVRRLSEEEIRLRDILLLSSPIFVLPSVVLPRPQNEVLLGPRDYRLFCAFFLFSPGGTAIFYPPRQDLGDDLLVVSQKLPAYEVCPVHAFLSPLLRMG